MIKRPVYNPTLELILTPSAAYPALLFNKYGIWLRTDGVAFLHKSDNTDVAITLSSGQSLANTYGAGVAPADAQIPLDTTRQGIILLDAATPIGTTLFGVQKFGGTVKFLDVTPLATSISGTFGLAKLLISDGAGSKLIYSATACSVGNGVITFTDGSKTWFIEASTLYSDDLLGYLGLDDHRLAGIRVRHILTRQAAVPGIAAGTGAGAAPTSLTITGTDTAFTITLVTNAADTPTASSDIATVTFNQPYTGVEGSIAPRVVIVPGNDAAADLVSQARVRVADTTTGLFKLRSGPTPLPPLTADTYVWVGHSIQ